MIIYTSDPFFTLEKHHRSLSLEEKEKFSFFPMIHLEIECVNCLHKAIVYLPFEDHLEAILCDTCYFNETF